MKQDLAVAPDKRFNAMQECLAGWLAASRCCAAEKRALHPLFLTCTYSMYLSCRSMTARMNWFSGLLLLLLSLEALPAMGDRKGGLRAVSAVWG